MAIMKANMANLDQYTDILFIPELGKLYFPRKDLFRAELEKGMAAGEVYVNKLMGGGITSSDIQGVIWYQREGLFHSFPFLHMIAVRDEYRCQGVGAALMDFYEQEPLRTEKNRIRTKAFLLVSDFNTSAQRFYTDRGYVETGRFENLFRKGVTEILMMKKVTAAGR